MTGVQTCALPICKVSLARALAVRSYLIDRGVKSRIDVGAFLAETPGGANERVDVVAPNT